MSLPLPLAELPQSLHRFANPDAPGPAKMMAAKGMVPVKGADLITLLVQLGADKNAQVSDAAKGTLTKLPENVLLPALEGELHPAIVTELAERLRQHDAALERLVVNTGMNNETLKRIARGCSESISELIAINQARLLEAPQIVEALYKNKNTRMSTADRLIELCARNGVELTGIPAFQAHVEAIQGQLIFEASDEPLPTDVEFTEAAQHEAGDEDAIERDKVEGTEEVKEKFKPLAFRIREMDVAAKLRLAVVGDAAARSILVRDANRQVQFAAISSPSMTESEATGIAHSKEVSDDILRYIGNRREWLRSYEIKKALVFNPKTPVGISMRFIGHLRNNDLKLLSRSRGVPNPLKTAARQRMQQKKIS